MGLHDDIATRRDVALCIDGRVGASGRFPLHALLRLVTGLMGGQPSIALVDVLASVRLAANVEVLLLRGAVDASVALPVSAVMRQPNVRLVLDRSTDPVSVFLHAPDWTESDRPVPVDRLTALTFAEFVMHP